MVVQPWVCSNGVGFTVAFVAQTSFNYTQPWTSLLLLMPETIVAQGKFTHITVFMEMRGREERKLSNSDIFK